MPPLRVLAYAARHPVTAVRARPPRLQPPIFRPRRECRRILRRHERVLAAGGDSLVGWQTHQPVLVELFRHLQAPRVLEAGIGYASTPLVLQLARESVSLETNPRWHRRFARFADDRHRILLVEDEASEPWLDEEWDLAFVDGSGTSRQACVDRLAERTRFVVCHDTEELFKPSAANFGWDFSRFEHVWTYTQFPNYTTVASTTEPIPLTHLTGIAGPPPPRSS